jgi:hypothetical protein
MYILAFFRLHQNSPSDIWNDVDATLVANNLTISQQRLVIIPVKDAKKLSLQIKKYVTIGIVLMLNACALTAHVFVFVRPVLRIIEAFGVSRTNDCMIIISKDK